MTNIIEAINGFVWGVPALIMILGVGIGITLATGCIQIRGFPKAMAEFIGLFRRKPSEDHGMTGLQTLCTALGATVGTGNLVGVAGAICIGGPGSIFWMWICGFLGMATKYAEAMLAVCYREKTPEGFTGGPMYIIRNALDLPWLAGVYCVFGVIAAFGVGNVTQINAVVSGIDAVTGGGSFFCHLAIGVGLAFLTGTLLLGGAKKIGRAAELLVPGAAAGYILMCTLVLICRRDAIPAAFSQILSGAFSPDAVTGGVIGSCIQALRVGCARGVFTNEAGMGTASIAHASAQVAHPAQQGLMGIVEVFLDTIVICTMTALVILCSGVPIPYGRDVGGALTMAAFSAVYGGWTSVFLSIAICCFAFATLLGWGMYGGCCVRFLFGSGAWKWFAFAQAAAVVFGAVMPASGLWSAAEAFNGLMAIPNLYALTALLPQIRRLTIEYQEKTGM